MLAIVLYSALISAGPWQNAGPGGGGWIQSIAYSLHSPTTIFVGCDVGGFYRSDDSGATWRIMNRGLTDAYVQMIVPHPTRPDTLYVATLSGVFRTDDGGETWAARRDGFPTAERYAYSAPVGVLRLDPRDPETLYAGIGRPREMSGGQGTIYVSRDGASHWQRLNPAGSLPDDAIIVDLLVRADGLWATTQHGLYRGTPDGQSWARVEGGLPTTRLRYLHSPAARPNTLYATVDASPGVEPYDGGVWRSDDAGQTWHRIVDGLVTWAKAGDGERYMTSQYGLITTEPTNPDRVYVAGAAWVNAGVFGSDDGGEHWRKLTQHDQSKPPVNLQQGYLTWGPLPESWSISTLQPGRLIYGTSGAVIETTDGGQSWHSWHTKPGPDGTWSGTGLDTTCLWTLAPHPTVPDRWLAGYMDLANWRTDDAGIWWRRGMAGVAGNHDSTGTAYAWDPQQADRVWAGIGQWGYDAGGLYVSEDGGSAWTAVPGLPSQRVASIIISPEPDTEPRTLWVALADGSVYSGPADGSAWVEVSPVEGGQKLPVVQLAWSNGPLALVRGAAQSGGGVLRRVGQEWQRLGQPFCWDAKALVAAGDTLYVSAREGNADGKYWPGGLWASTDGGATWRHAFDYHFIDGLAMDPKNPSHVVIGGNDHPFHDNPMANGVHESRDGGQTWTDITANLPWPNVRALAFDAAGRLLAGTHGVGLWWRSLE